jgi:hypothetical protein
MYSLSSFTLDLQTQRRRLQNVCEVHRKQRPSSNSKEDVAKSAKGIMIKRCILYILEHGTVPAVALALAIAPTNSRSWLRHDLTEPTKPVTKILGSEPRADTMTVVSKDREPDAQGEETIFGLRFSGNQDSAGIKPFLSLN